jgi:hypothetical protein
VSPEEEALGQLVQINPTLDRVYIERWASALGVADLWRRLSSDE